MLKGLFFIKQVREFFFTQVAKYHFLNNLLDLADYDVTLNKQIHQHKFPLAAKAE